MFRRVAQYFGALQGNARYCIMFHPLWSIPYMFYTYYLSMYLQQAQGVTEQQLGMLTVAGTASGLIFSLIAAPVIDAMGRKKATFVFDLLSSALPPLLYLISFNFALTMAAYILCQTNKIMSTAYYLVMIEDSDDKSRVTAFNLFNIITVAAGMLIPAAGILIEKYGLVQAERYFLLISFCVMSAMIIVRNRLLRETAVGKKIRDTKRKGWKQTYLPYVYAWKFLKRNPIALMVSVANIFFCVYMNIGTNYSLYFVPYFSDRLGMSTSQISVLGSMYYAGMMGAMVFLNPIISKRCKAFGTDISCAVTLLGIVFMIIVPAKHYILAIVSVLIMAIGYGMLKSGVEGAQAVYTQGEYQSGIYALVNLFSSLLGVIVSCVVSLLYPIFPGWLYIPCVAAVAVVCCCMLFVKNKIHSRR